MLGAECQAVSKQYACVRASSMLGVSSRLLGRSTPAVLKQTTCIRRSHTSSPCVLGYPHVGNAFPPWGLISASKPSAPTKSFLPPQYQKITRVFVPKKMIPVVFAQADCLRLLGYCLRAKHTAWALLGTAWRLLVDQADYLRLLGDCLWIKHTAWRLLAGT